MESSFLKTYMTKKVYPYSKLREINNNLPEGDFLNYTMHNKFSNFLCFASFLCSSLCSANQFQLQWREQDVRQMKPRNFRCHPLNRHLERVRIAEGVSKQKSHPL